MATLGIDFGSSYTTASWINPKSGKAEAVKFGGDGSVKYPSVIMGVESSLVMGAQALSMIEEVNKLPPAERFELLANFIPSIKRVLDSKATVFIGTRSYTHAELLEAFFREIREKAIEHCGSETHFESVVISHPVAFTKANIQLLEQGLFASGFERVSKKMEPVAAVQGYSIDHEIPVEQGIMVFDFGGGTIDVAYITKNVDGSLNILCEPRGDNNCGGQDLDMLLYEDLRKKIQSKYGFDISNDNMVDYSMLNACRRLKEYFSGRNDMYATTVSFVKGNNIQTYKYILNRDAFNNIISQRVCDAINVAKAVINQVEQKKMKIDKVLLIGGSSQLTLVRERLTEILPNALIDTCGEKDIAVALGNIVEQIVSMPSIPPIPKPDDKPIFIPASKNDGELILFD